MLTRFVEERPIKRLKGDEELEEEVVRVLVAFFNRSLVGWDPTLLFLTMERGSFRMLIYS
jgi:hypothetical protein